MRKDPPHIKKAKGTQHFDKNKGEIVSIDTSGRVIKDSLSVDTPPVMPKCLKTKRSKELWTRITSAKGVYCVLDESLLATYIDLVETYERVMEDLRCQELTLEGSMGQTVVNPLVKLKSDLSSKIGSLGTRLGLDPIARNSINQPENKSSDDDEFGLFN